jgi:hypothetical protein
MFWKRYEKDALLGWYSIELFTPKTFLDLVVELIQQLLGFRY